MCIFFFFFGKKGKSSLIQNSQEKEENCQMIDSLSSTYFKSPQTFANNFCFSFWIYVWGFLVEDLILFVISSM